MEKNVEKALQDLNERFVYLPSIRAVYEYGSDDFIRCSWWRDAVGHTQSLVVSPRQWLEWSGCNTSLGFAYQPGEPEKLPDGSTNWWRPPKFAPQKPPKEFIELWKKLLNHVLVSPEQRRWLLDWFAFPIQHVGARMQTAVVIQSRWGMSGKSFLGDLVGLAYGGGSQEGFTPTGANFLPMNWSFVSPRIHFAARKQFVVFDWNAPSVNLRTVQKCLESSKLLVHRKYTPPFMLANHVNVYCVWTGIPFHATDDRFVSIEANNAVLPAEIGKLCPNINKPGDMVPAWMLWLMQHHRITPGFHEGTLPLKSELV